jgi:hypothetical protein
MISPGCLSGLIFHRRDDPVSESFECITLLAATDYGVHPLRLIEQHAHNRIYCHRENEWLRERGLDQVPDDVRKQWDVFIFQVADFSCLLVRQIDLFE